MLFNNKVYGIEGSKSIQAIAVAASQEK